MDTLWLLQFLSNEERRNFVFLSFLLSCHTWWLVVGRTDITHWNPYICGCFPMNSLVYFQVAAFSESPIAHFTLVRFLSCMNSHVSAKVAVGREAFVALCAGERTLTSVDPPMYCEIVTSSKPLPTMLTAFGAFICVCSWVYQQGTWSTKTLSTNGT